MKLSPKAFQLILDHEVGGSEKYYNRFLCRPSWPQGDSGVTIGIGYDLGYTEKARFLGDWAGLDDRPRERLAQCVGLIREKAHEKAQSLRDIVIPWSLALSVFESRTLPFWIAETIKAFPNSDKLPADAFGALVSLVFNRGRSMKGPRRREMLAIHTILADGVQSGDLRKIANEIRSMERLWTNGVRTRREAEAKLVESCL